MEKVSVSIKIRVLFWPEINALGVFFNFDNGKEKTIFNKLHQLVNCNVRVNKVILYIGGILCSFRCSV